MKKKLNMLLYISFFLLLEIINELFFNEQILKCFITFIDLYVFSLQYI